MSLNFDGTSQYVSLGDAVNIYQTRPWSIFALIDTASLRTTGNYSGIFGQGQFSSSGGSLDRGWIFEVTATNPPKLYFSKSDATALANNNDFTSSQSITPATGLWLVGAICRDIGAGTRTDFYGYRYSTGVLTIDAAVNGINSSDDTEGTPVSAGDTTAIGVIDDSVSGIIDFFPGKISWVAIFAGDLGNAGQAGGTPEIRELITNGFWNIVANRFPAVPAQNCKLAISMYPTYQARDWSVYGHHGQLVAGPSYAGDMWNEQSRSITARQRVPLIAPLLTGSSTTLSLPDSSLDLTGRVGVSRIDYPARLIFRNRLYT